MLRREAVNSSMVDAYWQIGRHIVEYEQGGRARAEYGKTLLKRLAERLSQEFGKGFDKRNLEYMRQFYLAFPIANALRSILTWTHYRTLLRVSNPEAQAWYMQEAAEQHWSSRALERKIGKLYYERLLASKDKAAVQAEALNATQDLPATPRDFIRDPYVLDFLGLPESGTFLESGLENALMDNLQAFLLKLGKGFALVARQKCIRTDTKNFYIDLVFYNYLLKCFVLIDLKTGPLTHQDLGQMDMYVRMFEDLERGPDDNPTVGLILCSEKDEVFAKYSLLKDSEQIFASRYSKYLPTEEELRAEIARERAQLMPSEENE